MLAVVGMCVIMNAARFIVQNMSTYYKHKGEWQKPVLIMMPELFGDKKAYTCGEDEHRYKTMMVTAVAMPQ